MQLALNKSDHKHGGKHNRTNSFSDVLTHAGTHRQTQSVKPKDTETATEADICPQSKHTNTQVSDLKKIGREHRHLHHAESAASRAQTNVGSLVIFTQFFTLHAPQLAGQRFCTSGWPSQYSLSSAQLADTPSTSISGKHMSTQTSSAGLEHVSVEGSSISAGHELAESGELLATSTHSTVRVRAKRAMQLP